MPSDRRQAVDFYNRGSMAESDKADPRNVELKYQLYSSAVAADPTLAEGWFKVGVTNAELGHAAAAVAAWRRVLELPIGSTPGDLTAERKAQTMCNIGQWLYHLGKHKESREFLLTVLKINPKMHNAWCNLSMVQSAAGEDADAVASARTAYDMDPNPINEMQLALSLMFAGKYAEGLGHYEARFPYKLTSFLSYPYPKWAGERDKTLFLMADQGIGDTLSFARFLPQAAERCKFVHAIVQPELLRLFRAAFQGLANVNFVPMASCGFLPADCWSTFVSLPHHLGLTDDEILSCPGLMRPQFSIPKHWKSPDRKLHVGIAWSGSPLNDNNKWRSIPIEQFLELYRVPGIQLYSLQVGERSRDVHDAGAAALIRDLTPHIRDVADSCAILNDLDLVITVESALGHICGHVGKECWIPLSWSGDYRARRHGNHPIWYKATTLFRQNGAATWGPVFDQIIGKLEGNV